MQTIQPKPRYPREVIAACTTAGKRPEDLLAWAVRDNEVVLILSNGAKVRVKRRLTSDPANGGAA